MDAAPILIATDDRPEYLPVDLGSSSANNEENPEPSRQRSARDSQKQTELIVEALRVALSEPIEHRLFRAGKLPGLFPTRTGLSSEAALYALHEGLLEIVRTEMKGRLATEWVRPMPKGVAYLHDHDSPVAVLRDLRDTIGSTQAGIPVWMAEAKMEVAALSRQFERRAQEMITHLDNLTRRVEAALRRAELGTTIAHPRSPLVTWGETALAYLDRRLQVEIPGDCPLGELFHAVREKYAELTLREFHDGLRRMNDLRALRLTVPRDGLDPDPEYALQVGADICSFAAR